MHFDIQIWILKKNNRLHSLEKKMSYHTNTKISISRYGYLRRTTDYIHKKRRCFEKLLFYIHLK